LEVDRETIAATYQLIDSICSADAIFHSCQSQSFRAFVRRTLEAPDTVALREKLKRAMLPTNDENAVP